MPKKKEEITPSAPTAFAGSSIEPLTQEFGNGDLNVLRDKINEIITNR